jgi:hypothetical protein
VEKGSLSFLSDNLVGRRRKFRPTSHLRLRVLEFVAAAAVGGGVVVVLVVAANAQHVHCSHCKADDEAPSSFDHHYDSDCFSFCPYSLGHKRVLQVESAMQ